MSYGERTLEPGREDPERFSMLASAVARRAVQVRFSEHDAAFTDGEALFLPRVGQDAAMDSVVVQAALLAAESLEARVLRRLIGRRRTVARYLMLEAVRGTAHVHDVVVPSAVRASVSGYWTGRVSGSAAESLERALSSEPIPDPPRWFGTIRPHAVLRHAQEGVSASRAEGPRPRKIDVPELENEDEESEDLRLGKLFSSSPGPRFGVANSLFHFVRTVLGMGRQPTAEGGGGAELPVGGIRMGEGAPSTEARPAIAPSELSLATPPSRSRNATYPEWDVFRGVYRLAWCEVGEFDPPVGNHGLVVPDSDALVLRREVARIGRTLERHRRRAQGDGLDLAAVVDLRVATKAGLSGDTRVYEERLATRPDLGVLVLLDASGSTNDYSCGGPRIYDEQRQVVANLVAAFEAVGDRVAAYGFNSRGRGDVRLIRIKAFDEGFEETALRRLGRLQPCQFTRMGAALRHGVEMLAATAGVRRLLLVIVTDGLPYDDGYEGEYAECDARQALREAEERGVACTCISLVSGQDDSPLDRVFGATGRVSLSRASDLPGQVQPMFETALYRVTQGHPNNVARGITARLQLV